MKRSISKFSILVMAALLFLLPIHSTFAQSAGQLSEQAISQITHEVSNEILSPFCPGKTLAMCPSPAAADARRTIQELAEKGLSKEEIKDELIEQYGPEFRRVTPGLDDNIVVFVLIAVALVVCSAFVWVLTSKSRARSKTEDEDLELLIKEDGSDLDLGVVPDDNRPDFESDAEAEADDEEDGSGMVSSDPKNPHDDDYLNNLRNEYKS